MGVLLLSELHSGMKFKIKKKTGKFNFIYLRRYDTSPKANLVHLAKVLLNGERVSNFQKYVDEFYRALGAANLVIDR